jgi:hypothetical protein
MLETSVLFPTHEVNQVNSTLPLRGQCAPAADTATFVPVVVLLHGPAATLSGFYNCECCGLEKLVVPGGICDDCATPPVSESAPTTPAAVTASADGA